MIRTLFLCVMSTLSATLVHAAEPARIVCFGDSITAAGYPAELAKVLGVDAKQVINAGVGGNTTTMGLARIKKDVLDKKPSVVVVMFGANDSRLAEPSVHVPLEKFEQNLNAIADGCKKAGAKVVFCTLPPIKSEAYFTRHKKEPFTKAGGLEKVLSDYQMATLKVAKTRKLTYVDLHELLENDPKFLSPDGVHPSKEGTATLAKLIGEAVKPLVSK